MKTPELLVPTARSQKSILWFEELTSADVALVGGKNASLGEMYSTLRSQGIRVPNGFAVTASAYRDFMAQGLLDRKINNILADQNPNDIRDLARRAKEIRDLILATPLPEALCSEITAAYRKLCSQSSSPTQAHAQVDVAVRSSATAEDLPTASFAGQQETFLNVRGEAQVLENVKKCFASLYTDRAISYRRDQGFADVQVALSVGVQRMVRSDLASAGILFTLDTETGFRDVIVINAAFGLGETIVQGAVNPDEYVVFKSKLEDAPRPIIRKKLGQKSIQMVYEHGGTKQTKIVKVSPEQQNAFALDDQDILTLSRWAVIIEKHYSMRSGKDTPMDIEWAKDGATGELFIVQARPETVHSSHSAQTLKIYKLLETSEVLTQGASIGSKISSGKVRVISSVAELFTMQPGEVLVTDKTDPDWEPCMKLAAGIITNRGGRTCHAAIISRELGLPAIVGTKNATEILRDGDEVTLSCYQSDVGKVYKGLLKYECEEVETKTLSNHRTQVMLNIGNPDEALRLSFLPNDGVGLARMEFIISNSIKIHPMALIDFPNLKQAKDVTTIADMTAGYEKKSRYFVDKLAEGIGMLGAAFYPKPVIVRPSDFKTNEYAHLIGGEAYEPEEENPMIGFRGASRYYHERYRKGFALECEALAVVRNEMGLTNVKVMVPFCRTVDEGKKVLAEMAKNGLARGNNGLEVYVMCEIPANVILADKFAEIFDGFSIGSNDLTQLVLGIDRDSEILSELFDERNEAVKRMISQVIRVAKEKKVKIGICGQAPSDYPEFAAFLVSEGIDSVSLIPDALIRTRKMIAEMEKR